MNHPLSASAASNQRVVAHVDMDAFYVAVEMVIKPELKDKPCAVVQYDTTGSLATVGADNPARYVDTSRSGIIAVSYEARARGVKRNMTGQEARKICPDIQLVTVPTAHGKADLTLYRNAGARVVDVLGTGGLVERASVDEAYVDVTAEASRLLTLACKDPKAWGHVVEDAGISKVAGLGDKAATALSRDLVRTGHCGVKAEALGPAEAAAVWWGRPLHEWTKDERLLACGAAVVTRLRDMVYKKLAYTCSGGIAHNKNMAKLASGLHKPNQQTVVPASQVAGLMEGLPLERIRGLGGKLGEQVRSDLKVTTAGELAAVPEATLRRLYGEKQAALLADMARGVDLTPVVQRALSKSVSCGKTFYGNSCIRTEETLKRWLLELAAEIQERLDAQRADHKRAATRLTVHLTPEGSGGGGSGTYRNTSGNAVSRSCDLREGAESMAADAFAQVSKWLSGQRSWGITSMFIAADGFEDIPNVPPITSFFKARQKAAPSPCPPTPPVSDAPDDSARGGAGEKGGTDEEASPRRRKRQRAHGADGGDAPHSDSAQQGGSSAHNGGSAPLESGAGRGGDAQQGASDDGGVLSGGAVPPAAAYAAAAAQAGSEQHVRRLPELAPPIKHEVQSQALQPSPPTHSADVKLSPSSFEVPTAGARHSDTGYQQSSNRGGSGGDRRIGDSNGESRSNGGAARNGDAASHVNGGSSGAGGSSSAGDARSRRRLSPQSSQLECPLCGASVDAEGGRAHLEGHGDYRARLVDLPEDMRRDFEQRLEQLTRLSPPAGGIEQFLVKHTGAAPAPPLWYTAGQRAKPKGGAKKAGKGSITQYLNGK